MRLEQILNEAGRHKPRKRVGRGKGSGMGKTSGRGHKGQGSRAGFSMHPTFEGGQMPLARRIPKRGFNNRWALQVAVVNLSDLEARFDDGDEVTPESLRERNLAKGRWDVLKVLGDGELSKKLTVSAHRFSRTAREKIERAGGAVVELPGKKPVAKNKQKQNKQKQKQENVEG